MKFQEAEPSSAKLNEVAVDFSLNEKKVMKNKTNLILVVSLALLVAPGCNQNQSGQNQNKTAQVAANKAQNTNDLMQADTASTQTLSTTNSNANANSNTNR